MSNRTHYSMKWISAHCMSLAWDEHSWWHVELPFKHKDVYKKVCACSTSDGKCPIISTCFFNSHVDPTNFGTIWTIPTSDLPAAGVSSVCHSTSWMKPRCGCGVHIFDWGQLLNSFFDFQFHQKMEMFCWNIPSLLITASGFTGSFYVVIYHPPWGNWQHSSTCCSALSGAHI